MVRSMYSGVSGMRAHQYRMDTIGNNVSNVNTYGYKSSRATFRDVYYQSTRGASAASGNKGGMNPSQVGYGAQNGGIDKLMTQSTFISTGYPYDLAIDGEGFFQVQDADGSIFYTRAGMLAIDSAGNVVDSNGNMVLGVAGDPLGQDAGMSPIRISLPPVVAAQAEAQKILDGVTVGIKSSNETRDGNVSINFVADSSVPVGTSCDAVLDSSTGSIRVRLNPTAVFATMGDLNTAVNAAITKANKGQPHPGGDFTITADADKFAANPPEKPLPGLTGEEIAGSNFTVKPGKITLPASASAFNVVAVGNKFSGVGADGQLKVDLVDNGLATEHMLITYTSGGKTYLLDTSAGGGAAGGLTPDVLATSKNVQFVLDGLTANSEDSVTLKIPSYDTLKSSVLGAPGNPPVQVLTTTFGDGQPATDLPGTATASAPANDLGLSKEAFVLTGGNKSGEQTMKDVSNVSIGMDGIISLSDANGSRLSVGRIDLVTFDNPEGLQQSGNSYFTETSNSGVPARTKPGESGAGGTKSSMLEQSNVDLSQEFSDMIVTQRGFQANSRLITVSDTMLEELVNLKR